jgi:hypothetical protein
MASSIALAPDLARPNPLTALGLREGSEGAVIEIEIIPAARSGLPMNV